MDQNDKMTTWSAVESFTGGLFAATIVQRAGASRFFRGALVAYANTVKTKLGIDVSNGVINASTARAMAMAGRDYFKTDVCVAFTGNAGPEALENKPIGTVFIAFNDRVYKLKLRGSRTAIQKQAVALALDKLKGWDDDKG